MAPWGWKLDVSEEDRSFLQARVRLYTQIGFGIVVTLLAIDLASLPLAAPLLVDQGLLAAQRRASLAECVVALLLLAASRLVARGRPGALALWVFDAVTTLLVCAGLTFFVWGAPKVPLPLELMVFITLQLVLFVHAAVVPAPATRTVILHVLACAPLVWVAADRAARFPGDHAAMTAVVPVALGVWTTLYALVGGVLSWVIYGLRLRFRQALRLGQYRLEEKLGEGGMGVVYRAQHGMLRRPTAVKLLPPTKAGERTIARFEREVRHTSRLTHPNTVAIYDFGRTPEGVFYYAMELLDGLDLGRVVALGGPMPPARVAHVLRQCAGALAEAHELGLVHRDVKPENVVLCRRGGVPDVAKVLDFGLVKDLDGPTDVGLSRGDVLTGTPLYMSPEAIASPATLDGRADLYALGAVGWFLLVGRPPFEGRTVVEVCAKHLTETAAPPSRHAPRPVPPDLEAVILKLLEKDPAARYATGAAVESALDACGETGRWTRALAEAWWAAHPTAAGGRTGGPVAVAGTLTVAADRA